jgi:hypothetical protein
MDWGVLAAAGVLTIVPGAIVIWFVRNYIAKGFGVCAAWAGEILSSAGPEERTQRRGPEHDSAAAAGHRVRLLKAELDLVCCQDRSDRVPGPLAFIWASK